MHFQYIPAPFSIYREVRKLEPAHTLVFDQSGRTQGTRRYWNLEFRPDYRPSEAEWVERLDATLRETIRLHLVSDVPFGAFLSGGLDSSTVVAYMSQVLDQPVRTFSIGFEEDEYNECRYAREVAQRFGTEHHEEIVRPDRLAILPELVRHYGEPFGDSSSVPTYYVSRLAARHVKMVLSGDGGDENFAGYWSYARRLHGPSSAEGAVWQVSPCGRPRRPRPGLAAVAAVAARHVVQHGRLLRRPGTEPAVAARASPPDRRHRGLVRRAATPGAREDLTSRFQHFDIHHYLPDDILTKVDIASMCHGLEVRVPLLDHVMMELAAQIPPHLKLSRAATSPAGRTPDGNDPTLVGKYLLKKNSERFFAPEFLNRTKRGFEMPVRDWMAGKWKREVAEQLLEPSSGLGEFFETGYLQGLLTEEPQDAKHGWRSGPCCF